MRELRDAGPSFLYEPQVPDLRALLRDLTTGAMVIPRFQRRFVWTAENRVDLLRSIWEGIPIGTILVWRTRESAYRTWDFIWPHRTLAPPRGGLVSYGLDGHQRLTTLLGAFVPAPSDPASKPPDDSAWEIYYELAGDPPDFQVLSPGEAPALTMFPLYKELDGREVLSFQRSLARLPNADEMVNRCDELVARVRDCKVPIIPLFTKDGRIAKDSFVRMNKPIARMTELDLVNAARERDTDEFDERLSALKEKHLADLGWGDVSDRVVLDTCKLLLDLDLQYTDPRVLARKLDARDAVLDEAAEALRSAAEILSAMKIPGPALVPYPQLMALTAYALHRGHPAPVTLQESVKRWFWHTLYAVGDAGFNVTATRRAITSLLAIVERPESPSTPLPPLREIRPLPMRINLDHARPRALLLHWIRRWCETTLEDPLDFARTSTRPDTDMYLAPLYEESSHLPSRVHRSSFGNRFLASPTEVAPVRRSVFHADASLREDRRSAQMLDWKGLSEGEESDVIVRLRNRRLAEIERDFLAGLGVIVPSTHAADVPGPPFERAP